MRETLRCATCELPFGHVQQQSLVIRSSHHGEQHLNVIPLADLIALAQAQAVARKTEPPRPDPRRAQPL